MWPKTSNKWLASRDSEDSLRYELHTSEHNQAHSSSTAYYTRHGHLSKAILNRADNTLQLNEHRLASESNRHKHEASSPSSLHHLQSTAYGHSKCTNSSTPSPGISSLSNSCSAPLKSSLRIPFSSNSDDAGSIPLIHIDAIAFDHGRVGT